MSDDAFLAKLAVMTRSDQADLSNQTVVTPGQWDSVDVLDLIAAIDEVFGVTVDIRELNRCTTVGELRGLIARAKAGPA